MIRARALFGQGGESGGGGWLSAHYVIGAVGVEGILIAGEEIADFVDVGGHC